MISIHTHKPRAHQKCNQCNKALQQPAIEIRHDFWNNRGPSKVSLYMHKECAEAMAVYILRSAP